MVAAIFWLISAFLLVCNPVNAAADADLPDDALRNISLACNATRHKELCEDNFRSSQDAASAASDPIEFVRLAMQFALEGVLTSLNLAGDLQTQAPSMLLEDSVQLLGHSRNLLTRSRAEDLQLNESLSNVEHWLSAALTYNNDCHEFLRNLTAELPQLPEHIESVGIPLLSNALSVAVALSSDGANFAAWRRPTGTKYVDGNVTSQLAEWFTQPDKSASSADWNLTLALTMASAVVSKDPRFGTFTTIQAAVNAAPDNLAGVHRHVIFIKDGVYEENVLIPSSKPFLEFRGTGINRTIITGNLSTTMNITTFRTATLAVEGSAFLARDITVVNTAGPSAQAVAVRVDSDMSAFHRCSFWGYQDTLYTHAYRQFYKECVIYGTVDFIFGNAASVFQNCDIQVRPALNASIRSTSAISAQGRTDPAQATAFVCQNCLVRGTPDYMTKFYRDARGMNLAYLGRPWKPYARSIFIECFMDTIIDPSGWLPWDLRSNNTQQDTYNTTLAEFRSYGPGGNPYYRVSWSKQITAYSALQFTVRELIQGGFWLPFTGVPYRLAI